MFFNFIFFVTPPTLPLPLTPSSIFGKYFGKYTKRLVIFSLIRGIDFCAKTNTLRSRTLFVKKACQEGGPKQLKLTLIWYLIKRNRPQQNMNYISETKIVPQDSKICPCQMKLLRIHGHNSTLVNVVKYRPHCIKGNPQSWQIGTLNV